MALCSTTCNNLTEPNIKWECAPVLTTGEAYVFIGFSDENARLPRKKKKNLKKRYGKLNWRLTARYLMTPKQIPSALLRYHGPILPTILPLFKQRNPSEILMGASLS